MIVHKVERSQAEYACLPQGNGLHLRTVGVEPEEFILSSVCQEKEHIGAFLCPRGMVCSKFLGEDDELEVHVRALVRSDFSKLCTRGEPEWCLS